MKKGFVISWYYPPGNSSEGLVTFKLLKNSEYEYDVWTREDQQQSLWDRKSSESGLVAKNVKTILGPSADMKEWVRCGVEHFMAHKDEYDFVMSRSMPAECHEIAMKIKEKIPDIKWIASFGDPLVNTPYIDEITMGGQKNPYSMKEYLNRERLSLTRAMKVSVSPLRAANKFVWKKRKDEGSALEDYFRHVNEYVLENADAVIYNNKYQYEHAFADEELKKYETKAHVLEHSYDKSLYPEEKKESKKISFVYVGHLDDKRSARSLFEAIKRLKDKDLKLGKKVEFVFYGHISDGDKIYILDNELSDIIKTKGDVKYVDSLAIIKNADWAILIDANFTSLVDECIYLPAKIMDYMGAGTNILSISHVKGAGSDIIREVGGGKVVTHSADDIYLYLSKIIYQGYKPVAYVQGKVAQFESKKIAKKMDGIIVGVLKGKK